MARIKNIGITILYCILGIIKIPFSLLSGLFHTIELVLVIALSKLMALSTMENLKYTVGDFMDINAENYYAIYEKMDDLADELHGWKL